MGDNLVTWRSKERKVVDLSSVEAKFRGMTKGVRKLLWLKKLLTGIRHAQTSEIDLFHDNKTTIDISQNLV